MLVNKDHLPFGSHMLWQCPVCGTVNAYNHEDAERASGRLKREVAVCHGSCFDNICGHCGADIVDPESPINAECYTHQSR